MAVPKEVSFSLSDLDAVTHSSKAFEFPFLDANGDETGIYLSVLGGNADAVRTVAEELIDARRMKDAARQMNAQKSRPGHAPVVFDKTADDISFGQRLAAVRLVGWRGIKEPCTPENAALLCATNPNVAAQVMEQSDNMANFTKV